VSAPAGPSPTAGNESGSSRADRPLAPPYEPSSRNNRSFGAFIRDISVWGSMAGYIGSVSIRPERTHPSVSTPGMRQLLQKPSSVHHGRTLLTGSRRGVRHRVGHRSLSDPVAGVVSRPPRSIGACAGRPAPSSVVSHLLRSPSSTVRPTVADRTTDRSRRGPRPDEVACRSCALPRLTASTLRFWSTDRPHLTEK